MGRGDDARNDRNIQFRISGQLEYTFFPGTGNEPFNSEIIALVDATEEFYLDNFDSFPLTAAAPILDFRMRNIRSEYAPGGDLDRFVLTFRGIAVAPASAPLRLDSTDIARIMADANYASYIQNYVYELEPFTTNQFFQTNEVFFTGSPNEAFF